MYNNDANTDKKGGYDAKPAQIELRNGETLEATHHFITTDGWLAVYGGARSDGISKKIPPQNVACIDLQNPAREEPDRDVEPVEVAR